MLAVTNYIHIQELNARRSICSSCPHNTGAMCELNGSDLKHNLLAGECPKKLWPENFEPVPYEGPADRQAKEGRRQRKELRKALRQAQADALKNGLPPPPSLLNQAKSFASSMKKWAKDGFKNVSKEEHQRRLNICLRCPSYDPDGWGRGIGRCRECGCAVKAKTKIKSQKCPVGKW